MPSAVPQFCALLALFVASASGCGGGAAASSQSAGGREGCGGHPVTCEQAVERFLDDEHEASLVAMDLEVQCDAGRSDACGAFGFFLLDGANVPRDNPKALSLLDAACQGGWVAACARVGAHVAELDPGPHDALGARCLGRACDAHSAESCVLLGDLVHHGRAGEPSAERALAHYQRGCEGGSDLGCRKVADHYVGRGDRAGLERLYAGMCEGGRARGCTLLADVLVREADSAPAEEERVGPLLERACEGGDLEGCARLGMALARGDHGVPPDAARARTLLDRACDENHARACGELGLLFEQGVGGPPSAGRAHELYERACDRRSGLACYRLGVLARDSPGYRDLDLSMTLFRRACESGEAERACGSLAAAFDAGRGVPRDVAAALPLYHRACDGGHPDSCVRLADLVEAGDGAPADPERARAYRLRACELSPSEDRCDVRSIAPRAYTLRVSQASGPRAPRGTPACQVVVDATMEGGSCRVRVRCATEPVYGGDEGSWARCELGRADLTVRDFATTPFDGSPQLAFDSRAGTMRLGDVSRRPRATRIAAATEP